MSRLVVLNTAAKSMSLSHFCDGKAACSLLLNRASTSALLTDPDGRAEVLTVWIPKFYCGAAHWHAQVSSPHSAARTGVPTVKDVLQTVLPWQHTEKYSDKVPNQEMGSDAEMVTSAMPITLPSPYTSVNKQLSSSSIDGNNCTIWGGGCARRDVSIWTTEQRTRKDLF